MNQHQHIDTASDLRDLIAIAPTEQAPIAEITKKDLTQVQVSQEIFLEMRVQLMAYRSDVRYFMNAIIGEEEKKKTIDKLNQVLEDSSWGKVKMIYWKNHPASAGLYSFQNGAPQTQKLSPAPREEKDFWFFIWLFRAKV